MYIYWQVVYSLKNVALVFLESSVALELSGLEIYLFGEDIRKTAWRLGDGSQCSSSRGRKIYPHPSEEGKFTHFPVSLFSPEMVRKRGHFFLQFLMP